MDAIGLFIDRYEAFLAERRLNQEPYIGGTPPPIGDRAEHERRLALEEDRRIADAAADIAARPTPLHLIAPMPESTGARYMREQIESLQAVARDVAVLRTLEVMQNDCARAREDGQRNAQLAADPDQHASAIPQP